MIGLRSPFVGKKALSQMSHGYFSSLFGAFFGSRKRDYAKILSDPTSSSLVMATLLWIARRWPEAPMYLVDQKGDAVYEHPYLEKMNKPNPNYSGAVLWFGVILSVVWDGNGYIVKVRNKRDLSVSEYWYVPHFKMEPKVNEGSTAFVDYYEYSPGGVQSVRVLPSDVIHLRYGIDPFNPRKGFSPLKSIARDAATDEEADNFAASMLKNMGVPGLLFSPDFSAGIPAGTFDVEAAKKYIRDHFAGDHRGEPMVNSGPTKVQQFGFDPKSMDLSALRGIPEERIAAVTGVPAAVVGFGSGLAQTKVGATMKELREMAYEDAIIPLQRLIAPELEAQIAEYEPNPEGWKIRFDLSQVRVLQEDQNNLHKRIADDFGAGLIYLDEARKELGWEADEKTQHVRRVPFSMTEEGVVDDSGDLGAAAGGTVAATEIQQTALNGAQVQALVDLAAQVTGGTLPSDTARAIAATAFPMATEEDLSAIFGPLDGFEPKEEPKPILQPAANPGEEPDIPQKVRKSKKGRRESAFNSAQWKAAARHQAVYASELADGFVAIADRVLSAYATVSATTELAARTAGGLKEDQVADLAPIDPNSPEGAAALAEAAKVKALADAAGPLSDDLAWKGHYAAVTKTTIENMTAIFGVAFNLTDPVQAAIIAKGGRHFALVGVDAQVQEAIYKALSSGRAAGLGPREIARLIRSNVEGSAMYPGVYKDAYDRAIARGWSEEKARSAGDRAARQYRAEVISRTETKYAQNVSVVEVAKGSGSFDGMLAFDNQIGFNDEDCIARDGKIFSFAEAEEEMNKEHPNGTLSFSPVIRGGE